MKTPTNGRASATTVRDYQELRSSPSCGSPGDSIWDESETTELDVVYKKDRTSMETVEALFSGTNNNMSFSHHDDDDDNSSCSTLSSSSSHRGNYRNHPSLEAALNDIIKRTVSGNQKSKDNNSDNDMESSFQDKKTSVTSKASLSSWRTSITSKSSYFIPGITGRARCLEGFSVHLLPKPNSTKSRRRPSQQSRRNSQTSSSHREEKNRMGDDDNCINNDTVQNQKENCSLDYTHKKKNKPPSMILLDAKKSSSNSSSSRWTAATTDSNNKKKNALANIDENTIASRIQQHQEEINTLIHKEKSTMESTFYIPGITERSRRLTTKKSYPLNNNNHKRRMTSQTRK